MAGPQNAARRIERPHTVVAKDAALYTIGGVPAKSIRKRFDDATIEKLPALRWWDWPEEAIRRNLPAILAGDIAALERGR